MAYYQRSKTYVVEAAYAAAHRINRTMYVRGHQRLGYDYTSYKPKRHLVATVSKRRGIVYECSKDLDDDALRRYEKADCGVRALHLSTGVSYREAHTALSKAGRPDCTGTWKSQMFAGAKSLGFKMVRLDKHWLTEHKTLVSISRNLPPRGGFIILVADHYAVAKDGKLFDRPSRRRIQTIWRVEKS